MTLSAQVSPTGSQSHLSQQTTQMQYWEEVTTIFVVGFPEDFTEREFCNMFTFAAGFESATLKIQQLSTTMNSQQYEDYYRRQIIGFAKFATLRDAQQARQLLNGRRVDFSGMQVKAEMAKKNLHMRRVGTSDMQRPGVSMYGGGQSNVIGSQSPMFNGYECFMYQQPATHVYYQYEGHDSLLPDIALEFLSDQVAQDSANEQKLESTEFVEQQRQQKFNCFSGMDPLTRSCLSAILKDATVPANVATPLSLQIQSPLASLFAGSATTSKSTTGAHTPTEHTFPFTFGSLFQSFDATPSAEVASEQPKFSSQIKTYNQVATSVKPIPNDQNNQPCNTLYVGNLPLAACEDELRMVFSKCPGYRKLLHRVKNTQGPMCFVEFDTVQHATYAMQQLYGYPLSNSTKGGIRLSYSKNPLGVRPQYEQQPLI